MVPVDAPADLVYNALTMGMGNNIIVEDGLVGVPFSTIYGVDLPDLGSLIAPTDVIVSKPALLRSGRSDDQGSSDLGLQSDQHLYPQMVNANLDGNFTFHFGAAEYQRLPQSMNLQSLLMSIIVTKSTLGSQVDI